MKNDAFAPGKLRRAAPSSYHAANFRRAEAEDPLIPQEWSPQESIGHYRIISKLGQGGMGAVYRATDTKLHRDVAIKVLPDSFAANPVRLARFTREAQVLAWLNHPNIAAIYGVEERALVLELVDGPTLAERIAQGPIAPEEALPIIQQLIDGLEYAHERGVVHRDLKPTNIKITGPASGHAGRVKILDFGLAKAMGAGAATGAGPAMGGAGAAADPGSSPTVTMGATAAGVIIGTANYMAPEQARGQEADERADIWAFGAVVYEMLTGEQLFDGATVSDRLAAVLSREPVLERVPPAFRTLVRVCLVKDARQRLRDIGDARFALADGAASISAPPAHASALRRLPWIVAAAFALCALASGGLWLRRPAQEPHAIKFTVPAPAKSAFMGLGTPAVSPDGRRIAFAATADGKDLIWVRDLDSMAAHPLAGTEGITIPTPFWSPDSRFVAFFSGGKLKKVDASGGPALTLCAAPFPRGGSWSRRDTIVFSSSNAAGLMRIPAAGGDPVPVTELDSARGETSHRWPWFLPDGRHFLFLARSADPEKTAIWVGDLESRERDGKTRRRVVTAASNAAYDPHGFVLFLREHTLMAQRFDAGRLETAGEPFPVAEQVDYGSNNSLGHFSLSETGVLAHYSGGAVVSDRLTWLNRTGKALGTLGPSGVMRQPAISPDGGAVAIERANPQGGTNIWLHDVAHATDSRFTFSPGFDGYPVWSPGGTHILFASNRGGKWGQYAKAATGVGKEELLFESPHPLRPSDWSRDGKFVIYTDISPKTGTDIWVLPNPLGDAASRKPYAFVATDADERSARLSPDGKYLAYQSDESHDVQVYVQSFPGKQSKFQISPNGGTRAVWSRDGKELFYIALDGKMMAVDVKTGAQFEHGNPKPLFETHTPEDTRFDISPDGKRFLIIQQGQESGVTSLMVVSNWRAGLKK